jgi:mono/diheme cytochrome c family protein
MINASHVARMAAPLAVGWALAASAAAEDLQPVDREALRALFAEATAGAPGPVDQRLLNRLVRDDPAAAFILAFDAGDELTEATFTAERGVGANVRDGQSFSRYPRADLDGDGEWASHVPAREGGPQAQSCITCHAAPLPNGAGGVALNVAIDPVQLGDPALYLERNTLHLFALGGVQRVAEEMTAELQATAAELGARVCRTDASGEVALTAKDVAFGVLKALPERTAEGCRPRFDTNGVEGVDDDLVVRMFGWKGTHATIRDFARGAAHNELGLQATELVGDADGDHDGVTGELSVGDLTALTVYMAGLERPVSKLELAERGLLDLAPEERTAIETGERLFAEIGCASCHKPTMVVDDPVFREPSAHPDFAEKVLPSGVAAAAEGLTGATAITFDLTADQPNNRVVDGHGRELVLGTLERDDEGRAILRWYSDFRRHDMGPELADPMDAYGIGASVWPTRSLAGVGSTGPWLHDGHATTLDEAIRAHGGDAAASRAGYVALAPEDRADVVSFLENLVIVDLDPETEHAAHGAE